jgi:hypothetical protein
VQGMGISCTINLATIMAEKLYEHFNQGCDNRYF